MRFAHSWLLFMFGEGSALSRKKEYGCDTDYETGLCDRYKNDAAEITRSTGVSDVNDVSQM